MFIREFKETLRQTVFIMAFFVLIPMLYLLDHSVYSTGLTFIEYISNGLDLFILITAVCLAYNMFRVEQRDGATEYLLSLPIRRWNLLKYKVMPRIAVLTIFLLIGSIVNDLRISDGSVLGLLFINWRTGLFFLTGFIVFVQLCGFMLGMAGRDSWSVRLMLLGMILCVWQYCTFSSVIEHIVYKVAGWVAAVKFIFYLGDNGRALLDFSVFFALLWYILKPQCENWDLKSTRVREICFQKRAVLPMTVFLMLIVHWLLLAPHFLSIWL